MWRGVSASLLPPQGRGVQVTLPEEKTVAGTSGQGQGSGRTTPLGSVDEVPGGSRASYNNRSEGAGSLAAGGSAVGSVASPGPCLIRKEPEVWGAGYGPWGMGYGVWGMAVRGMRLRGTGFGVRVWGLHDPLKSQAVMESMSPCVHKVSQRVLAAARWALSATPMNPTS